ncbi:DUF2341 domain-containing protein [Methanothermococcus sp.]|uniref:DUF2341 domain-containing protein n=1 Tax=Methanothermococcus sp. TaxID=2614238 RepID=UPI0025EFFB2C|nr:DUF2341 domain-containing protein [Methanothermococcus sp.]
MYASQSMIVLVLLLFLTGTILYNTIDIQKQQVLNEMKASSVDLKSTSIEHVVTSSISPVFNKVLNDAELEVIRRYNNNPNNPDDAFFKNTTEVVEFLKNDTINIINNSYLANASKYYNNQGYNFSYRFNITNITMVDGFTFKIDYIFEYNLSKNGIVNKSECINSSQYATVKTILDAYHYIKPTYMGSINISNPNNEDLNDFQVKVVLNNSNFNFSLEPNGTGLRFYDENKNYVPYWIEYWNYSNDNINNDKAIVWLKVPHLKAHTNTTVYIISTYPKISESKGDLVFELFDGFEYNDSIYSKWNVLYGTWNYDGGNNNDNPLYNSLYNRQIIKCENAPPVARMISNNNITLNNYIIEVDAKGDNNYQYWSWSRPRGFRDWPAPNIMVGYFANPQYYGETTTHPDAFYTLDLGGRYNNNDYALYTNYGQELYWHDDDYIYSGLGICNEYPVDYYYVYRTRTTYSNNVANKNTWYHIKILINGTTIYGTYSNLSDYLQNNENNWMISKYINNPYGSYFELGTSMGFNDENYNQNVYFDNFRVRKYAPIEPTATAYKNMIRKTGIIYISPNRDYGTHYGDEESYNPYFVEDTSNIYPSIIDMLAGKDTKEWEYGYSIKLEGY